MFFWIERTPDKKYSMKRKVNSTLFVLLLALATMSFKCGGSESDPRLKYLKAADDLARTISSMITTKRSLAKEGRITPEEELKATIALLSANRASLAFLRRVQVLKTAPDEKAKAELADLFSQVTSTLNKLDASGLYNLRDMDARHKFLSYKRSAQTAVAVLSLGLGCRPITEDCVKCEDGKIYCSQSA